MQRASLDLHNLTGVLAMPFHFVIALSGIVILFSIYWPSAHHAAYPQAKDARQAFLAEGFGQYRRAKANTPGQPLASLDAMLASAEAQWQGGKANFIRVWHPGDTNSYVELRLQPCRYGDDEPRPALPGRSNRHGAQALRGRAGHDGAALCQRPALHPVRALAAALVVLSGRPVGLRADRHRLFVLA
ncbi:PepSY domain-containing protein [Polaromonas sp. P2-4]|nr:PepSY domain-containing protein [Polaromonas sp. P2-4]